MWSTVTLFVLTFAILGLLLGIAEVYDVLSSEGPESSSPAAAPTAENSTSAEPSGDNAISTGD